MSSLAPVSDLDSNSNGVLSLSLVCFMSTIVDMWSVVSSISTRESNALCSMPLINMLSIKVAVVFVILVGRVMVGIIPKSGI